MMPATLNARRGSVHFWIRNRSMAKSCQGTHTPIFSFIHVEMSSCTYLLTMVYSESFETEMMENAISTNNGSSSGDKNQEISILFTRQEEHHLVRFNEQFVYLLLVGGRMRLSLWMFWPFRIFSTSKSSPGVPSWLTSLWTRKWFKVPLIIESELNLHELRTFDMVLAIAIIFNLCPADGEQQMTTTRTMEPVNT